MLFLLTVRVMLKFSFLLQFIADACDALLLTVGETRVDGCCERRKKNLLMRWKITFDRQDE